MEKRLSTALWVSAHLRQCAAKGVPVYVVHKGAAASGTVIVRIVIRGADGQEGSKLLTQSRDSNGIMGWLNPYDGEIVDETRANQYIERALSRDPDVWVIEVEDNNGTNPFEGKIF